MAAHKYKGGTYFYSNGKWMDSMSKSVSKELEAELNREFPEAKTEKIGSSKMNLKVNKFNNPFCSSSFTL